MNLRIYPIKTLLNGDMFETKAIHKDEVKVLYFVPVYLAMNIC